MTKLKEGELLGHLKDLKTLACSDSGAMWVGGWIKDDEQAYQQIRELIQSQGNLGRNMAQSQGKVTEEWIEEKAKELKDMQIIVEEHSFDAVFLSYKQIKDFIRSLVEEIGCTRSLNKTDG